MQPKPKLSIQEQINHFKSKGLQCEITNEKDAYDFLEKSNFYFKLSAYRKNYQKNSLDQYVNLDFAYLQDLSTIDYEFRILVLDLCLDVEHAVKLALINDITKNPNEDGYSIVNKWDPANTTREALKNKIKASYAKGIIDKYHPDYPVWALCELLTFGSLCKLVEFYDKCYPGRLGFNTNILYPIRNIRNACAHNNCLINNLGERNLPKTSTAIISLISQYITSKNSRKSNLHNKLKHDLACLLCSYPLIVKSQPMKAAARKKILYFIFKRCLKNANFYSKNSVIHSSFIFFFKLYQAIKKFY